MLWGWRRQVPTSAAQILGGHGGLVGQHQQRAHRPRPAPAHTPARTELPMPSAQSRLITTVAGVCRSSGASSAALAPSTTVTDLAGDLHGARHRQVQQGPAVQPHQLLGRAEAGRGAGGQHDRRAGRGVPAVSARSCLAATAPRAAAYSWRSSRMVSALKLGGLAPVAMRRVAAGQRHPATRSRPPAAPAAASARSVGRARGAVSCLPGGARGRGQRWPQGRIEPSRRPAVPCDARAAGRSAAGPPSRCRAATGRCGRLAGPAGATRAGSPAGAPLEPQLLADEVSFIHAAGVRGPQKGPPGAPCSRA